MTRCPVPQVEREVSDIVEPGMEHCKNCLEVALLIQEQKRCRQSLSGRAIVTALAALYTE